MALRAAIIDDEPLAIEALSLLIEAFCPKIEIVGTASNIIEGIKLVNKETPQILFLDIEMPNGTGFDLIESITLPDLKVIFTTAYDKYAIKAIKTDPVDYLLKPIDSDELINAVDKAETLIQSQKTQLDRIQKNKLTLKTAQSIYIVNIENIIRCESDANYTHVFLDSGEKILVTKTLKEYELKLTPHNFFRVHQSHLINLNFLAKLDKSEGMQAIMKDTANVPVSSRKRDLLIKLLEQLS